MGSIKIPEETLYDLANIYNTQGKQALIETLQKDYNLRAPYSLLKRMKKKFKYDEKTDSFETIAEISAKPEELFMSMEELCSPVISCHDPGNKLPEDMRPAAMDRLIRDLIGDRLLELSKYVTIDSLSKRILLDKTSIIQDGYQLIIH